MNAETRLASLLADFEQVGDVDPREVHAQALSLLLQSAPDHMVSTMLDGLRAYQFAAWERRRQSAAKTQPECRA